MAPISSTHCVLRSVVASRCFSLKHLRRCFYQLGTSGLLHRWQRRQRPKVMGRPRLFPTYPACHYAHRAVQFRPQRCEAIDRRPLKAIVRRLSNACMHVYGRLSRISIHQILLAASVAGSNSWRAGPVAACMREMIAEGGAAHSAARGSLDQTARLVPKPHAPSPTARGACRPRSGRSASNLRSVGHAGNRIIRMRAASDSAVGTVSEVGPRRLRNRTTAP